MDTRNIADTLDGLSSETRLDIFRLLVRAGGGDGLAVGVIAERLGISASTLAFHLRSLVGAGLVWQEKRGRKVMCHDNLDKLRAILQLLEDECCREIPVAAHQHDITAQRGQPS